MEKPFLEVFPGLHIADELKELLKLVVVEKVTMTKDRSSIRVYIRSPRLIHKKNIYALEGTEVLVQRNKEVQMAAHDFGKGRAVYISGVPYSFANSRTLYRAILWSAHSEDELHTWFSSNYNVEVHAYVKNGKYCVVNNTYEPQDTTVYTGDGSCFDLHLDTNEIKWYSIEG